MPYEITIDPERRVALVVGSGWNDYASSLAAMDELAGHADYRPGFGMFCDFRESEYTPGPAEARNLAEAWLTRFRGRPLVVVVSGLLHYGLGNMMASIISLRGVPVAVFRDVAEAEAWMEQATAASA